MSMYLPTSPSGAWSGWSGALSASPDPAVCVVRLPTSSQPQFVLCVQLNHVI